MLQLPCLPTAAAAAAAVDAATKAAMNWKVGWTASVDRALANRETAWSQTVDKRTPDQRSWVMGGPSLRIYGFVVASTSYLTSPGKSVRMRSRSVKYSVAYSR